MREGARRSRHSIRSSGGPAAMNIAATPSHLGRQRRVRLLRAHDLWPFGYDAARNPVTGWIGSRAIGQRAVTAQEPLGSAVIRAHNEVGVTPAGDGHPLRAAQRRPLVPSPGDLSLLAGGLGTPGRGIRAQLKVIRDRTRGGARGYFVEWRGWAGSTCCVGIYTARCRNWRNCRPIRSSGEARSRASPGIWSDTSHFLEISRRSSPSSRRRRSFPGEIPCTDPSRARSCMRWSGAKSPLASSSWVRLHVPDHRSGMQAERDRGATLPVCRLRSISLRVR